MLGIVKVFIKIIAKTPPAIAIALGFLLIFVGHTMENPSMISSGWGFTFIGFLLQVLWLLVLHRARW